MTMIRTELYKLFTYKKFFKYLLIMAAANLVILTLILAFFEKLLTLASESNPELKQAERLVVTVAGAFKEPFIFSIFTIFMYIAAVSFFFMDFQNGYVKNIAGQVRSKNSYVTAKLAAVAASNLVFMCVSSLTYIIAAVLTGHFEVGSDIPGGLATFLIKWLLSIAICSLLMFFAVGIKNHVVSVIFAVIYAVDFLSLAYTGVNYGIKELFKTSDFDITHYVPSTLFGLVDAIKGDFVINALIVSVVFTALFIYLTCLVFKKRDIH